MFRNILTAGFIALFFSACVSTNLLRFGELDNDVANQGEIINNFNEDILTIEAQEDIETISVILPKDDMTVRVKIKVANIEDVLYMNIVDHSEFNINKLIRRVSDLNELDINQDGWMFEPSIEKGIVTLQLYLPSVYLYNSKFSPQLLFSYKRGSRALQESIQFNFIRQQYYPAHDENGYEIAQFGTLEKYCEGTGDGISENFLNQIDQLNSNRIDEKTINKLKGLCQ